jgi:hypothetical protein
MRRLPSSVIVASSRLVFPERGQLDRTGEVRIRLRRDPRYRGVHADRRTGLEQVAAGRRDLNVLGPEPHSAWAKHDSGPGLHECGDQRLWQAPERVQSIAPSLASGTDGVATARSSAPAAMNAEIGAVQAAPSAYASASRKLRAEDALQHDANARPC